MNQKRKETILFGLFALLVICIRYPLLAVGTHTFFDVDWSLFCQPVAVYNKAKLLSGEIPFWCPLLHNGVPYFAQWNTMLCYPGILFYLILPVDWGLNLFQLFHAAWGATGMYLLARRFNGDRHIGAAIIGLSYELNGVCLSLMNWPQNLSNYSWVPWVILLQLKAMKEGRQWIGWAALANGLHLFTGLPEYNIITWTFSGALGWAENHGRTRALRYLGAWVGTILLGMGIAAVQLIPSAILISTNANPARGQANSSWALGASGLINFIFPTYDILPGQFTDRPRRQFWMSAHYTNLGLTALAFVAAWRYRTERLVIAAFGVGAGWLLLAGGWDDALMRYILPHIPVINKMRYPIKFLLAPVLALHLVASLFWRQLSRMNVKAGLRLSVILPVGALGLSLLFGWLSGPHIIQSNYLRFAGHIACGVGLLGLLWCSFSALAISRANMMLSLTAAVLLLNSWIATRDPNPIVSVDVYKGHPVREYCQSAGLAIPSPEHGRFDSGGVEGKPAKSPEEFVRQRRELGAMNNTLSEGLSKSDGFVSVGPRWQETFSAFQKRLRASGASVGSPEPLLDFCAVSLISGSGEQQWVQRSNAMALVSAGQVPLIENDSDKALGLFASINFNPRTDVILEEPTNGRADREARALIEEFADAHWTISVETKKPTLLVISQTWYPGWRAKVNGKTVGIQRANTAFQAVEVPAGKSNVQMDYSEPGLNAGLACSCLSTLISIALIATVRFNRKCLNH